MNEVGGEGEERGLLAHGGHRGVLEHVVFEQSETRKAKPMGGEET